MIDLINGEEDVKKLKKLISDYSLKRIGTDLPYIDLVVCYNNLLPYENYGKKLFAALVDLKMNFVLLTLDSVFSSPNDQQKLSTDESILDNPEFFDKRFEVHRHNANYIIRYRAIWDKIMGILLLISSEKKYDQYNSAKSRKKSFENLSKDIDFLSDGFAHNITQHIQKIDNNFRTGEVHLSGSLRKYSFLHDPFEREEYIHLRSSWNYMLFVLNKIDKLIGNILPPKEEQNNE